ncbi:IS5 family transposase [Miltoncostaea marina]|uniref:IS5 family transposase n=1 Tax=Miltoncostaea marina TaxID=2843215 RepID=UPI001C3CFA2E|nr:IS5 family transposase [Miltoncostaea marina]
MAYPSDVTDDEWRLVCDLLEPASGRRGRPPAISRRAIADAILYLARTGSPWRYLPSEQPAWGTVWRQFRRWRDSGVLAKLLTRLRQIARLMKGRTVDPSMLMVDAQVARGGRAGPSFHESGGRGGRTNGAKRTLLLDITGSPVAVRDDSARPQDVRVARELLEAVLDAMPSVKAIVADRGYRGLAAMCARRGIALDIKAPPKGASRVTPLRPLWRIEDAFARLGRWRRLSRSYEGPAASARAWMEIAACHYLLGRVLA